MRAAEFSQQVVSRITPLIVRFAAGPRPLGLGTLFLTFRKSIEPLTLRLCPLLCLILRPASRDVEPTRINEIGSHRMLPRCITAIA